jgi:hypothetical protein
LPDPADANTALAPVEVLAVDADETGTGMGGVDNYGNS